MPCRQEEDALPAGGNKGRLPGTAQHLKGHVADDNERLEDKRHALRAAGERANGDDFGVIPAEQRHNLRRKKETDCTQYREQHKADGE